MTKSEPHIMAILCEDVREEANKKHTLVGVFAGDIHVPHFPANIRLAAYLVFYGFPPGEHDLGGEVFYGGASRLKLEAKAEIPKGDAAVIVMPSIVLTFEEEGQLEFHVRGADGQLMPVISKHISIGKVSSFAPPAG
jgi:hypothetical protein